MHPNRFSFSFVPGISVGLTIIHMLFTALSASAIPTWIGVPAGVVRQTGGNPGTFTIEMNQSYATLHASVAISVNGAAWAEYPMTFDGKDGKNWKWSHTPSALFPASASVRYYFRGWDDGGGNIFDGNAVAPYLLSPTAPPVVSVNGDADVFGSTVSIGSWLDDLNRPLLYLSTIDGGTSSLIKLSASRAANDWIWERGAGSPAVAVMMRLDALNRLTLFDPSPGGIATIVLDPNPAQAAIFVSGQRVLTTASAAVAYLPLNPARITIGVNNVAGNDAIAVGSSSIATGQNSAAFGMGAQATGDGATAIGDHTTAQGAGQFVAGAFNLPSGTPNGFGPGDQLFAVGNGTDANHRANAVTVLRNGNVGIGTAAPAKKLEVNGNARVAGALTVDGAIVMPPQGDLSMGEFTHSPTP